MKRYPQLPDFMGKFSLFLSFFLFIFSLQAQVGIGNTNPDPSSMLDISSTSQGLLAPRMTTLQRNAIATPANSLLVYDTDANGFFYYDESSTSWIKLITSQSTRDNYKLIKSANDLASELVNGGGSKYLLDANSYYEINGTIILAAPIELNDSRIAGKTYTDVLYSAGTVFSGSTGGTIMDLVITGGGIAFNITGGNALVIQNTSIIGMSSVGNIAGVVNFFSNNNYHSANTTGIIYSNNTTMLLNNQTWAGDNAGTFEKYVGNFNLIQKISGFSIVNGTAVGFDVSSNPTVITGILLSSAFTGTGTFIKRYTVGSYTGYNFNNNWFVDCPGIPREGDAVATGDINLSAAVGAGQVTSFSGTGTGSRRKVQGTTTSNNLFRFERSGDNRIIYRGAKNRYFQVNASVSYQSTADITLILYIAKNGVVITQTKVYSKGTTGYFVTDQGILAVPIVSTVELNSNDYIEIWAERYGGSGNMDTVSLNLTAR